MILLKRIQFNGPIYLLRINKNFYVLWKYFASLNWNLSGAHQAGIDVLVKYLGGYSTTWCNHRNLFLIICCSPNK